jgi:PBP1b-binding outer membrane lipoprotein LpoB
MLILSAVSVMLAGCAGPAINPHARSTFLNSHDLVNMTDQMAASIASDPIITKITARHPMVIVLTPLKNDTNELIPRDQGDTFLHRVRVLLTAHQSLRRHFEFVLNPATFNRLQKQEGISTAQLGPRAGRVLPQYALQATFYADTKVAPKYRSDYYLCTFFLTNIHSGRIIWEGSYETKKAVHGGFLY